MGSSYGRRLEWEMAAQPLPNQPPDEDSSPSQVMFWIPRCRGGPPESPPTIPAEPPEGKARWGRLSPCGSRSASKIDIIGANPLGNAITRVRSPERCRLLVEVRIFTFQRGANFGNDEECS